MLKKIFGLSSYYFSDRDHRMNDSLYDEISLLKDRVKKLESDYIELTNALYETENRLQSQIDSYHPQKINLNNFGLGE